MLMEVDSEDIKAGTYYYARFKYPFLWGWMRERGKLMPISFVSTAHWLL